MRASAARGLALATIVTVLALPLGACHDSISTGTLPSLTTPITDTFTGSLVQKGSNSHQVTITATAPITMALTDVQPLSTMGMGVGLATWNGTTCGTAFSKNDNARSGATALTGTATAGSYCILVYDSGNIPSGTTVSYTIQIVHY